MFITPINPNNRLHTVNVRPTNAFSFVTFLSSNYNTYEHIPYSGMKAAMAI